MIRRALLPVLATASLAASASAQDRPTDQWLATPVDQATFDAYLEFFTYSKDVPFNTTVGETTLEDGVRTERFTFQSTPGVTVTALFYHPSGVDIHNAPAIVFLHGGSGRGKDAGGYVRQNQFMARAGLAVLAIDLQHYGERADGLFTTFDEMDKHEKLYNDDPVYLQWMQQTVKDIGRAFDWLVAERGVNASRIGLVGRSRGAVVAMIAGAADARFAAVAVLHGGHFDFFEDGHRAAACPANYIGRISPRPLLLFSAELDQDFLPETAIRPMHRLARDPVTIRWTPGGHGTMTEEDSVFIVEWLQRRLAR